MTALEKYIWVVNALYSKGERGLSLKELNDKWMRDVNISNGEIARWLLDAYSTANTLAQSTQLKDRILLEEVPSTRNVLTIIIEAMKENIVIQVTHKDFNAKEYFSTFFGVVTDESVAVERIVIRAYGQHQQYVRSLPIHPSQKELCANDAYADFELRLRPTYDFIMELLRVGNMIEVIEPLSLRKTMKGWASGLWELYKND